MMALTVIEKLVEVLELRVFSERLTLDDAYEGEFEITYAGRTARVGYSSSESFAGLEDNELLSLLTESFREREIYLDGEWEDESDRMDLRELDMSLQYVFRDRVDELSEYLRGV